MEYKTIHWQGRKLKNKLKIYYDKHVDDLGFEVFPIIVKNSSDINRVFITSNSFPS